MLQIQQWLLKKNLETTGQNRFVSRLPASYKECNRVIEEAVGANDWVNLGELAEIPTRSQRPTAVYKVFETSVHLYEKSYRALVAHSTSHDKRRQKKLDKKIVASSKEINAEASKFNTVYFCEADAKAAAEKIEALSLKKLHSVQTTISPFEVRKRGRPPLNKPAPSSTRYRLSWKLRLNTKALEHQREIAGCFVLLSNVPVHGEGSMDSKKILETYKGQYGVESDFAFLKDPIVVNDIFIKKPHRIDALGMILIIALIIWRLMERSMRSHLKNSNESIEGWCRRKTEKPTSFMMTTAMVGIMVAVIKGNRLFLKKPGTRQTEFLIALGLKKEVFLDPLFKCIPIIPENKTSKG